MANLTPRELQVVELVAEGKSNRQIAVRLGCSYSTVKNHMTAILDKLHCYNRTGVVLVALREHIVAPATIDRWLEVEPY